MESNKYLLTNNNHLIYNNSMSKNILTSLCVMVLLVVSSVGFVVCTGRNVTEADLTLTIVVNSQTFYQGNDIEVTTAFKNQSGKRLRVKYGRPMVQPYIARVLWVQGDIDDPPVYGQGRTLREFSAVIKRNETKKSAGPMGNALLPGEYELVASAAFRLRRSSDYIRVVSSNSIILTVLENKKLEGEE